MCSGLRKPEVRQAQVGMPERERVGVTTEGYAGHGVVTFSSYMILKCLYCFVTVFALSQNILRG
jgi:hypothetical protein